MTLVSLDNSKFLMVLSYGVASLEKKRRPIVRNIVLWEGCLSIYVGEWYCLSKKTINNYVCMKQQLQCGCQ